MGLYLGLYLVLSCSVSGAELSLSAWSCVSVSSVEQLCLWHGVVSLTLAWSCVSVSSVELCLCLSLA